MFNIMWHEIFMESNFSKFHGFSNDLQKLDPAKVSGEVTQAYSGKSFLSLSNL